ncbi:MAG: helix-turn-helix domain-containing protein [Treponema sp.]|jgi:transcriptional regulator with XRE-family HTH domain|nr:helix-turn-helix domain-containing protein [Treponema sp.]
MSDLAIPAINERIREIRSVLGLSQVKFSSIIALSNGYIGGVETGHIPVNDRLIKLVCSSFNISESWIRHGEGEMFLEPMIEDKRFNNLVNTVRALPPKYQEFLFGVLDMLIKLKDK